MLSYLHLLDLIFNESACTRNKPFVLNYFLRANLYFNIYLVYEIACLLIGSCYLELSRPREAEEALLESIGIYKAVAPDRSVYIARGQNCYLSYLM